MKEIKLTHDKVALVDDEDYDNLMQYKWRCVKQKTCYYVTAHPKVDGKFITLIMHRFIMNAAKGTMIDHSDCNGLNNQKSNLRFASYAENGRNRRPNKKHKYKGVTKSKNNTYIASLCYNGKRIKLGTFNTPEYAAMAYNEGALKYFGEFARLNIIERLPIHYRLMMLSW
jgi:hypothetical protein